MKAHTVGQTFVVLQWMQSAGRTKSVGKSCARTGKTCIFSQLCTPDQSLCEADVTVRFRKLKTINSHGGKVWEEGFRRCLKIIWRILRPFADVRFKTGAALVGACHFIIRAKAWLNFDFCAVTAYLLTVGFNTLYILNSPACTSVKGPVFQPVCYKKILPHSTSPGKIKSAAAADTASFPQCIGKG